MLEAFVASPLSISKLHIQLPEMCVTKTTLKLCIECINYEILV